MTVPVGPLGKGAVTLGFTRGYMQSGAYVHRFGKNTPVVPKAKQLDFDTNTQAGTDNNGQPVTFAQIYNWMGETAREQIFDVLNTVLNDPSLTLKVFTYDLNEPDVVKILLTLAEQGRVGVILDNASLHVTKKGAKVKTPEDQFTDLFQQRKKSPSDIVTRVIRARFWHDKILSSRETRKCNTGPHRLHKLLPDRVLRERQSRFGLSGRERGRALRSGLTRKAGRY